MQNSANHGLLKTHSCGHLNCRANSFLLTALSKLLPGIATCYLAEFRKAQLGPQRSSSDRVLTSTIKSSRFGSVSVLAIMRLLTVYIGVT